MFLYSSVFTSCLVALSLTPNALALATPARARTLASSGTNHHIPQWHPIVERNAPASATSLEKRLGYGHSGCGCAFQSTVNSCHYRKQSGGYKFSIEWTTSDAVTEGAVFTNGLVKHGMAAVTLYYHGGGGGGLEYTHSVDLWIGNYFGHGLSAMLDAVTNASEDEFGPTGEGEACVDDDAQP